MLTIYMREPYSFVKFLQTYNCLILAPIPLDEYARIEKSDSCACQRDIVICNDTVTVKKNHHCTISYSGYILPDDITERETVVIVTWLLRFQFKTFKTKKGERTLDFDKFIKKDLNCCESYTMKDDPVFMLGKILVSPYGVGELLEKVTVS